MSRVIGAIAYNLKNLTQLKGRDGRATFWPYAGVVVGSAVVVLMAVMTRLSGEMAEFAEKHPDQANVETGPGHYSIRVEGNPPEVAGAMSDMMIAINLLFVACITLLAAAVARRLHDTGRSGAWGLMPVPFILFSASMMARLFGDGDPHFGLFVAVFASNLFYLASLGFLVVLLAKPSDTTSNSHGLSKTA